MQGEDPDVGLMLAYCAGNEDALADLYRRWSAPLRRYLERMVRETATAEELVQESFLRVHRARDRYRPDARFSTWLFQIARNLALNELSLARRSKPHLSADAEPSSRGAASGPPLRLVSDAPSAADVVETREQVDQVEAALAALPERQRSALWLASVEGRSYAEIAEVLGTSPSSVKSLVHRGRAALAGHMAGGR